ncbi:MAG: GNAT family N-acetyltransferase [Rubrobacteraceae bacterium]
MRLFRGSRKLVGDRVELRRHDRANYPLYDEWYGNQEIWHLTSWSSAPLGSRAVRKLFDDREISSADDSFAIHVKGEDRPIGVITLTNISETHESADLSVIVGNPEDRDQGYGREAIRLILRHGFEDLNLNRIALSVFEFNTDAFATYNKLGFHEEGRFRQAIKRGDTYFDAILMSLTKPEWQGAKSP